MIYPDNFENKVGFNHIKSKLSAYCMCQLGKEKVRDIHFSNNATEITIQLNRVQEFRRMMAEADDFPLSYYFDMREQVSRLRIEGTYMEDQELWDLKRSLETIHNIIRYLCRENASDSIDNDNSYNPEGEFMYPSLQELTNGVRIFPNIVNRIGQILDQYGRIKDSASQELFKIRQELKRTESSISHILSSILRSAQQEGLVDKDVTPSMRDGRLVIPVAPAMKRKLRGIVHDESATGKTVFIEPAEVVEANNRVRELEGEELREVIRILKDVAMMISPFVRDIAESYKLLAEIDFIRAKSLMAEEMQAYEVKPSVSQNVKLDYIQARHPLLEQSLKEKGGKLVPLDITLTDDKRMLIISGPNAGGKSVCLKTTGLLQYMMQCGLSIPVSERSTAGIFDNIMIDIGDEQSLSDDLSTYSGHLTNMKQMIRNANAETLILIDEFGTGTEPGIGGAIAEAVLNQFCKKQAYGVITTHYQNLKEYADKHEGIANGAMLYDRNEMQALFQLQIGRPGSSFAIEIARKIGLPEEVIQEATDIVGQDYIKSDKYLQDIVRDKRYWESKRQQVHQREKDIEKTISKYEAGLAEVEQERKAILRKAKEQAEELLREANKKIENTIREIREQQAEKEATRKLRDEMKAFEAEISNVDSADNDEKIARQIAKIQARRERKAQQKNRKNDHPTPSTSPQGNQLPSEAKPHETGTGSPLAENDFVRMKGTKTVGKIEKIEGKTATVIFGDMRTKLRLDRLERASAPKQEETRASSAYMAAERSTRETIDNRREHFRQDIDVRGMRGDEALTQMQYFIDDAILVGVTQVRILHGKGNGILRQLIRQYLSGIPNVLSYRDEHVQFGGAGITVVELE